MQPSWKQFRRQAARAQGAPTLTIQKRGSGTLNKPAYEALGKPEAVRLLFDEEQQILGLQPSDPNDPDSYPVRAVSAANGTRTVSLQALLSYYEIPLGTSTSYRFLGEMIGDTLAVDLRQRPEEVQKGRRSGSDGARASNG